MLLLQALSVIKIPSWRENQNCYIPVVGPEILTGSTRMKAGTAQKMVLNMISTTVMIKLGKVYSNLMVDLQPTNKKLRERTRNIFIMITESSHQQAADYLIKANYNLKSAIVMYKRKCSLEEAEELLKKSRCFEKGNRLNIRG